MDRRETLKSLLVGTVSGGLVISGCAPGSEETGTPSVETPPSDEKFYGRTKEEKARDEQLRSEMFFNQHELETIAVLVDLILPANDQFGSATDAGVPEFIEFIVKDLPDHQLPLRGGLMWLDNYSNRLFEKEFKLCSDQQHKQMLDSIAWPEEAAPELGQGVSFFSLMKNLTLTGYYTTRMGIDDLGYVGNTPNVWDGVPEDVLQKHGLSYEPEWLAKCIDQETRFEIAQWDDEGNLLN